MHRQIWALLGNSVDTHLLARLGAVGSSKSLRSRAFGIDSGPRLIYCESDDVAGGRFFFYVGAGPQRCCNPTSLISDTLSVPEDSGFCLVRPSVFHVPDSTIYVGLESQVPSAELVRELAHDANALVLINALGAHPDANRRMLSYDFIESFGIETPASEFAEAARAFESRLVEITDVSIEPAVDAIASSLRASTT